MPIDWPSYQQSLSPFWLSNGRGGFYLRALGSQKARVEDTARTGTLQRFPAYADADAKLRIGLERQLDRYPALSNAQWAAMLQGAFTKWSVAGTAYALTRELQLAFPGVASLDDGYIMVKTAVGRTWVKDVSSSPDVYPKWQDSAPSADGFWNRFTVYFVTTDAAPSLADGGAASYLARSIVNKWRAAHMKLIQFVLVGANTRVWGGYNNWATPLPANKLKWGAPGLTWGAGNAAPPITWAPPGNQ